MEDFWQHLGRTATSDLQKMVSRHPAWVEAWRNGPGSEVLVAAPTRLLSVATPRGDAPGTDSPGGASAPAGAAATGQAAPLPGEGRQFADPEMESARRRQEDMEPEALHLKEDEVRFTLDGRRVTKWRPSRRIN